MSEEMVKNEGQVEKVNPFDGLQGDAVWEEAKKYPNLLSALDSRISIGVNSFKDNKMPAFVQAAEKAKEEAIRAEFNPKETPTEKQLREANERITAMENKERLAELQNELSLKAKELGFDPIDARDFSVYGNDATSMLEKYAARETERVNERLNVEIKNKYSKDQPKRTNVPPADLDTRIKEARASGQNDLALKLQMMKNTQK